MPLPPPGSFQDAVMREVLFRERNREYITHITLLSGIELLTQELIGCFPLAEASEQRARREAMHKRFTELMKIVEDEVFEERYMPERIREEERAERVRRAQEIESQQRDVALAARLKTYG